MGHSLSMKRYVGNSSDAEGSLSGGLLRASLQKNASFLSKARQQVVPSKQGR